MMPKHYIELLKKLNVDDYDERFKKAIDCVSTLGIKNKMDYYAYQSYVDSLMGIKYEDISTYNELAIFINNDLEACKKMETHTNFKDFLIKAINTSKELSITSQKEYYSYYSYFESLANISYLDLSYFERMKCPEYKEFIIKLYNKRLNEKVTEIKKVSTK